jgi:hypothetical protein
MCEMWFMNIAGNYILKNIYSNFSNDMSPSIFAQEVYKLISQFDAYESIYEEIQKILDPTKPVSNIKRLKGKLRNEVIEEFISQNEKIIFSEIYSNFYLQETA